MRKARVMLAAFGTLTRGDTSENSPPERAGNVRASNALVGLSLAFIATLACAQNPGSRLRTTPQVPPPPAMSDSTASDPAKACAELRGEERSRCLADVRKAPTPVGSNGPGATGMGTGAASTGMAGGAAASTAAPR